LYAFQISEEARRQTHTDVDLTGIDFEENSDTEITLEKGDPIRLLFNYHSVLTLYIMPVSRWGPGSESHKKRVATSRLFVF
jgi:hypothetical protein